MTAAELQSRHGRPNSACSIEPAVAFSRYRFLFSYDPAVSLPAWTGSMWRGALGHALRRTACVTGSKDCDGCLLRDACAYSYLFDTPPLRSSTKMQRYNRVPHPYLIDSFEAPAGGILAVTVVLVGKANGYLPYLVHAMTKVADQGLGRDRVALRLLELRQERTPVSDDWISIYLPGGNLQPLDTGIAPVPALASDQLVTLQTPLRVNRNGRLVGAETLRFGDLFNSLLRRLSMLSYFHTDTPFETDFAKLSSAAREVPLFDAQLAWKDQTRYSNRQRSRMQMGGVVGSFTVRAGDLDSFWPILWLGQWLHAGKATVMGLGRYRLSPAASLQQLTSKSDCREI